MKSIYALFFLIIIVLASGCAKLNQTNPTSAVLPAGTFSGKYLYIHQHNNTGIKDTVSTSLVLTMRSATGYTVTGDTSTVHAASQGSYLFSSDYSAINFVDSTYPKTGTPAKHHLNGVYEFVYDGANLEMAVSEPGDSTVSLYVMVRIGS